MWTARFFYLYELLCLPAIEHFHKSPTRYAPPGAGTTVSYEITFTGYTGPIDLLVMDTSELDPESGDIVSAEAVSLQEGTEPLRGDFTLIFQGQETAALSYNATADEVTMCPPDAALIAARYSRR